MRNASFHNTFEKIYRRTLIILPKMRYEVSSINSEKEIIIAKKQPYWFSAKALLEISIRKIDENSVTISVKAEENKRFFFSSVKGSDKLEEEFISMLSSHM